MKDPRNQGKNFILPYHPGRRIVKGDADPHGGAVLARFHGVKEIPEGNWHSSPQEIFPSMNAAQQVGIDPANHVKDVLALPAVRNYVSDATLNPGVYKVELSFTVSGGQQADIKSEFVTYRNTRSLKPEIG